MFVPVKSVRIGTLGSQQHTDTSPTTVDTLWIQNSPHYRNVYLVMWSAFGSRGNEWTSAAIAIGEITVLMYRWQEVPETTYGRGSLTHV